MSKYKPNRIFALQSVDHSGYWSPREKPSRFKIFLRVLFFVPAIYIVVSPSFNIGRGINRDPGFPIPDKVIKGSVLVVPVPEELPSDAVQLEGRPMVEDKQTKALIAPAVNTSSLDIAVLFSDTPEKWTWKKLIPKYEHPLFAVFSKRITVEEPQPDTTTSATTNENSAQEARATASALPPLKDIKVLDRTDGDVFASCWTEPKFELVDDKLGAKRNRWTPRVATLGATAPGEVIVAGQLVEGEREKEALIYHGGGLYSLYLGLKETSVRKGDKVKAGDTVGIAFAGNKAAPIHAKWGIYMSKKELDQARFLAASSRLCKETATSN